LNSLTIAVPKGRLLKSALDFCSSLGFDVEEARNGSRKLIVEDAGRRARVLLLKPVDVLTFVEYGAADAGIVGQDVLREREGDVFEPLTLPFGHCRLILAGRAERAHTDWRLAPSLRIATKYPNLTRRFFSAHGWSAEIISLNGSVEIAPALGLADLLVDIVDTGRTLRENGLVELEEIMRSQAALIVNRASHTLRFDEISALTLALRSQSLSFPAGPTSDTRTNK
jgi:ATP phosphoribosyltransferase